jgi:hypothetical protein
MSTFNPSDGSVTGTTSDGSFIWAPPFTSLEQIDSYIQALQGVSSLKKQGIIMTGNLGSDATLSAVATGSELPAVQVYKIDTPPIFAVVYTDSNGASKFSYKNDPTNRIRLVQGGSKIDPLVSGASPMSGSPIQTTSVDAVKQTGATGSTGSMNETSSTTQQSSSGGILGFICWCLSCMSSIGFVCLIGFIVYMALKKQP